MVREVIRFLNAMKGRGRPYILTLSGKSGTGKTHCAKAITRWYNSGGSSYIPRVDGCYFLKWSRCLEESRSGNYEYLRNPVRYAGLLVVDEIGADLGTKLENNELFKLVDNRMHRWTILTTNQTIKSIAQTDTRVASRLVRHENVLVENNDPDWCVQKWKEDRASR